MSPGGGLDRLSTRFRPSKAKSLVILVSLNVPSSLQTVTGSPILTRAVEHATDGDAPEVVARVEVGDQDLERAVDACRAAAARAR